MLEAPTKIPSRNWVFLLVELGGIGFGSRRLPAPRPSHRLAVRLAGNARRTSLRRSIPFAHAAGHVLEAPTKIPSRNWVFLLVELGGIEPPSGTASRYDVFKRSPAEFATRWSEQDKSHRAVPIASLDSMRPTTMEPQLNVYDTRVACIEHRGSGWVP